MNQRYEMVLVFDPALSDADIEAQLDKVSVTAKAHQGEMEKADIWGRRELAYPINKKQYGIYAVVVFSGDNKLVAELRRQLRINDQVLRSLVVHKDRYAPDASKPASTEEVFANVGAAAEDKEMIPGFGIDEASL